MKNSIVSDTELKALLGISGTQKDPAVNMYNQIATDMLHDLLSVSDLVFHSVTEERNEAVGEYGDKVLTDDFPVDDSETIIIKDLNKTTVTGRTYGVDDTDKRTVRIYDSSGDILSGIGKQDVYITYKAGYTIYDTIKVLDYASLVDKTITVNVAGTVTTWTFKASGATGNEINAETSNDVTADNIATALGGTVATDTATMPLGTKIKLGTATSAMLTVTNATIPDQLKLCVALIAAGGLAQQYKRGGVASYTLGSKTVNFRDKNDATMVKNILKNYGVGFLKSKIKGI